MPATRQGPETVEIDLGGHTVTVPRGGLYDRYRMRTDLDEVARDPRVSGVLDSMAVLYLTYDTGCILIKQVNHCLWQWNKKRFDQCRENDEYHKPT